MSRQRIVIVGGGIAGLAFAYEALRRGCEVTIIEQQAVLGGLTRSLSLHGCVVDLGPHLLHLRDKDVYRRVREVVPEEQWVKIVRNGKLYIEGRYIDWPLRPKSALQLPIGLAARILLDQLSQRPPAKGESFEENLLAVYGPALYHALLGPLARKFLREDPKRIHADWAYASIRAATKIEDRSFVKSQQYLVATSNEDARRDFSIVRFALQALKTNLETEDFYYFRDGFGVLADSYAAKIQELGGKIRLNSTVERLVVDGDRISHCVVGDEALPADAVLWSGSLKALSGLLQVPLPPVSHLHTKLVYYFLKPCRMNFQCCYFADTAVPFNRGTILSNHAKTIIRTPDVSDVLVLEYTYRSPEAMVADRSCTGDEGIERLRAVKLIQSRRDVVAEHVENVPYTYPVLDLDYKRHLATWSEALSPFTNLLTLGRQGRFSYENSDIIIGEAIRHPFFQDRATGPAMGEAAVGTSASEDPAG